MTATQQTRVQQLRAQGYSRARAIRHMNREQTAMQQSWQWREMGQWRPSN